MVSRMDNLLTPPSIASLTASLTPDARTLLSEARRAADKLELELWAVGGTVRDTAVGQPLVDVDLAVSRAAGQLASTIATNLGAAATFEERFGTASVAFEGERLDLATLRDERYETAGSLPTVTLGTSIERDLERRDFNVNAIALGLTGPRSDQLVDPFAGLADLARRRFAILHDRSFEDDATRIWRAARLSTQRNLRPTTATRMLLTEGARWLDAISGDRLWSEFQLIAERGRAGRTLGYLDEWGALAAVSPALALSVEAAAALRHRWRPLPAARLAAVVLARRSPNDAAGALRRLNAPSEVARTVEDARALLGAADQAPADLASIESLERLVRTEKDARLAARWLDPGQEALQPMLRRWERSRPHLDATALLAMGVPEGPEVGELLRRLHRGRYLGTLGTVAEARALVRHHLDRREDAG